MKSQNSCVFVCVVWISFYLFCYVWLAIISMSEFTLKIFSPSNSVNFNFKKLFYTIIMHQLLLPFHFFWILIYLSLEKHFQFMYTRYTFMCRPSWSLSLFRLRYEFRFFRNQNNIAHDFTKFHFTYSHCWYR